MLIRPRVLYLATTRCYNTTTGIHITPARVHVAAAGIDNVTTRYALATAFFFTFFCVRICIHKNHLLELNKRSFAQ